MSVFLYEFVNENSGLVDTVGKPLLPSYNFPHVCDTGVVLPIVDGIYMMSVFNEKSRVGGGVFIGHAVAIQMTNKTIRILDCNGHSNDLVEYAFMRILECGRDCEIVACRSYHTPIDEIDNVGCCIAYAYIACLMMKEDHIPIDQVAALLVATSESDRKDLIKKCMNHMCAILQVYQPNSFERIAMRAIGTVDE